jgi:hypothetical protein
MDFELLDGYLLDESPPKAEVVRRLLANRGAAPGAAPYFEGLERLGARTPDLALMALRLTLAGAKADDDAVRRLRELVARARRGDAAARDEYRAVLRPPA